MSNHLARSAAKLHPHSLLCMSGVQHQGTHSVPPVYVRTRGGVSVSRPYFDCVHSLVSQLDGPYAKGNVIVECLPDESLDFDIIFGYTELEESIAAHQESLYSSYMANFSNFTATASSKSLPYRFDGIDECFEHQDVVDRLF